MPVDPLEEARERLARDLELQDGGGMAYTCHDGLYTVVVQGEDLRLILAELDRRPPLPTGEGEVAVAGLLRKTWHDFRYPPRGTPPGPEDADVFDAMAAALAAAPPPPDVSRGLDREEVAPIIHRLVLDCSEAEAYAAADAIIALSAPDGGGLDSLRPSGAPQLACSQSRTLDEPHIPARAIHYEEADVLEWIVRDVPTVAQATDAGDLLLDLKTREPIGFRIYDWSKRAPLDEPESAAGLALVTTTCFECGHDLEGPWCPACNPPQGWRDLESAPRDGSAILVCNHLYTDNGFLPVAVRWRTYHPNAAGDPCFRDSKGQKVDRIEYWQPLPAPPLPPAPADTGRGE